MDSVRVEKQPNGKWKIHVPGQPDIFLTGPEMADLINCLDETKERKAIV